MARILIVEDEKPINQLMKQNLVLQGHQVVQAFDGREALKILDTRADLDLVILDIMLPYMSGMELIKEIKDIPVMFVTAKDGIQDKLKGLTSGAEDYLVKPFDMLELRLAEGSRVQIRPSGTEPKLKCYLFAGSEALLQALPKDLTAAFAPFTNP